MVHVAIKPPLCRGLVVGHLKTVGILNQTTGFSSWDSGVDWLTGWVADCMTMTIQASTVSGGRRTCSHSPPHYTVVSLFAIVVVCMCFFFTPVCTFIYSAVVTQSIASSCSYADGSVNSEGVWWFLCIILKFIVKIISLDHVSSVGYTINVWSVNLPYLFVN